MRTLPTAATLLAHYQRSAPMARLFMTTSQCSFYEPQVGTPDTEEFLRASRCVGTLGENKFFHGDHVSHGWVRRLSSEGGGWCAADAVEEVG